MNEPFHGFIQRPFMVLRVRPRGSVSAQAGFGLIEVMVALVIVTTVVLAAQKINVAINETSQQQARSWLARLCIERAADQLRLEAMTKTPVPPQMTCSQAQHDFVTEIDMQATANPDFRKLRLAVKEAGQAMHQQVMLLRTQP